MKAYNQYEIGGYFFTIAEDNGFITMITLSNSTVGYNFGETPLILKTKMELEEYFEGKRTKFDIPLKFTGTCYQNKVWEEMTKISYGTIVSYQELARRCGNEKASRAIGNVCHNNKILILVPCHRVLAKNHLGGFGCGLDMKIKLLELEKVI